MSARKKPMWHPPMSVGSDEVGGPSLTFLQQELSAGKLIGSGSDGAPHTHPFAMVLGLENKRGTPDLLMTGFPLEMGLKMLEVVISLTEGIDYSGKNMRLYNGITPVGAVLGGRDIARMVPRAADFYGGRPFRMVQCVSVDELGFFPWQEHWPPSRQYYWGRTMLAGWDDVDVPGLIEA